MTGRFLKIKDLAAVGSGNVISKVIAGVFWIYIASLVGVVGYGNLSYFVAIAEIGMGVALLGVANTNVIFTSKEGKTQSYLYPIALIAGMVATISTFLIFENVGVSVIVFGNILFSLVVSGLLGLKQYKKWALFFVSQKILMVILAISLYYVLEIDGILLGIGLSFLPFGVLLFSSVKKPIFNFKIIKSKFNFMMHSYGSALTKTLSQSLDKLIIAPIFGFELLGNYYLGFQVITLMSMLPASVAQYTLPQDASGIHHKKLKIITVSISIVFATVGVFIGPKVLPFFFPQFADAAEIIQIMSIAIVPLTINLLYNSKLFGLEKSKFVLIGSIIFVTAQIVLILTLGQIYKIFGIALAFVIANWIQSIYLFIIDRFKI